MTLSALRHGIAKAFVPSIGAGKPLEALMKSLLTAAFTLIAAPALALEPINTEKHINETLLMGFIADAIDDNCDTISARKLKALGELLSLRDYALDKGYSREVVTAFVKDDAEKARRKVAAAEWLKAKGAAPGQAAAYCTVGAEEIAKGSLIGQLLRSDG